MLPLGLHLSIWERRLPFSERGLEVLRGESASDEGFGFLWSQRKTLFLQFLYALLAFAALLQARFCLRAALAQERLALRALLTHLVRDFKHLIWHLVPRMPFLHFRLHTLCFLKHTLFRARFLMRQSFFALRLRSSTGSFQPTEFFALFGLLFYLFWGEYPSSHDIERTHQEGREYKQRKKLFHRDSPLSWTAFLPKSLVKRHFVLLGQLVIPNLLRPCFASYDTSAFRIHDNKKTKKMYCDQRHILRAFRGEPK